MANDVFSSFGVSPDNYEYDPATNSIKLKQNSFDERWNLPVQQPSDIVGNVLNVPTIQQPPNPNLYGLPVEYQKPLIEMPDSRLVNDYQVSKGVPTLNKLFGLQPEAEERFQTWPERMARSGLALPADVYEGRTPVESVTGYPGSVSPSVTQMEPRSIPKALGMGNFTVPGSDSEIARAQDTAGMAGMGGIGMTPKGALGTSGSRAIKSDLVDWNLVGQLERKLSPEASRAIDSWVGGHPDFAKEGGLFGIWSPKQLKEALKNPQIASELEVTMKPIKDQLKAEYGDTIELHRSHGNLPEGAKPDRELLSFTSDRQFAEAHGGVTKPKKIFSESEISKFEKEFDKTGKVEIGKNVYLEKGEFGGADLFVGNEHITGYNNIRDYFNQRRESALEHNTERDANLKNVVTKRIPIDDIVFATDRFGQKEFIVRNRSQTLFEDSKAATGIGAINQSGFYSNLERVIANSKLQKATPEQWTNYLKNQPGIKGEELEFSLSNLPNKQLTKAELEAHIAENGVKLGENFNPTYQGQEKHYSQWQLPGATPDSYRELTLTVSKSKNSMRIDELETQINDLYKRKDRRSTSFANAEDEAAFGKLTAERSELIKQGENNYTSSHWDEPNVLAHIRMNDREIPGVGKSLHIEEIQSDWHQAGRKQGYKQPPQDPSVYVIDGNGPWTIRNSKTGEAVWDTNRKQDAEGYLKDIKDGKILPWRSNDGGVPNAPFKKSWDELALKRALTEAVQQGAKKELENYHSLVDSDPDKVAHALVKSGKLREICD